jgi:hypothetical protein
MNAAGQASGLLTQQRPAADILARLVAEAAEAALERARGSGARSR